MQERPRLKFSAYLGTIQSEIAADILRGNRWYAGPSVAVSWWWHHNFHDDLKFDFVCSTFQLTFSYDMQTDPPVHRDNRWVCKNSTFDLVR